MLGTFGKQIFLLRIKRTLKIRIQTVQKGNTFKKEKKGLQKGNHFYEKNKISFIASVVYFHPPAFPLLFRKASHKKSNCR